MELSGISVLDLYFLVKLVGDAVDKHEAVLARGLKELLGPDWKAKLFADFKAYRAAVQQLITEQGQASQATSELNRLRDRFTAWRRHMEHVARQEQDVERQRLLLKAAGYGLGTPRSPKDLKDFLVVVAPLVKDKSARFKSLGVLPAALEFPASMASKIEQASSDTAKEISDVTVARTDLRTTYAVAVASVRTVDHAAGAAREGAVLTDDADGLKNADALLALLDASVAQARVEARKRAEEEPGLEELTVPQPVPAPEGGASPSAGGGTVSPTPVEQPS